jgi:hypothetical protein
MSKRVLMQTGVSSVELVALAALEMQEMMQA